MKVLCCLMLLIAVASAIPEEGSGRSGYVTLGGREYFFDTARPIRWTESKNFCRTLDMFIVSIETVEEWDLIKEHINNVIGLSDFWTGGNDYGRIRGDYVWDATGDKVLYTDWNAGEPSYDSNEFYIEIIRDSNGVLKWNDRTESGSCFTICEQA